MNAGASHQLEMSFLEGSARENGYDRWQTERRAALKQLARRLGLPLERAVEVELKDGIRLKGMLRLREDLLWVEAKRDPRLELTVSDVVFTAGDVASCVRLD